MIYERLMEGQVALVTGAGKGIGKAVIEAFSRAGAATIYMLMTS